MRDAEDSRGAGEQLAALFAGLASSDPTTRRLSVRGLGRLERTELVEEIGGLLVDAIAEVRVAAVHALGQSVPAMRAGEQEATRRILALLQERIAAETDATVLGAIAVTAGRLGHATAEERAAAERLILQVAGRSPGTGGVELRLGAARGLEVLLRRHPDHRASPEAVAWLRGLVVAPAADPPASESGNEARLRRLAVAALMSAGALDEGLVVAGLGDRDDEVRRLAAGAAVSITDLARRASVLQPALAGASPRVRVAALRALGSTPDGAGSGRCAACARAVSDPDPHVRSAAIDSLWECPGEVETLVGLAARALEPRVDASAGEQTGVAWHDSAHALVALAGLDAERLSAFLPRYAEHSVWQLRMYAARAAGTAGHVETLAALAGDSDPNVREAALRGLIVHRGHQSDDAYLEGLSSDDGQLLMAAAQGLEGTPRRNEALAALLGALERVTAQRRETSRDPRLALLERLGELAGDADPASPESLALRVWLVESGLADFDPKVAGAAAEMLEALTGEQRAAAPRPLLREPLPSSAELEQLGRTQAVLRLVGGGEVVLRLYPEDAPANVWRFVRRARSGYFDGLTFHRVVPNFVIQGGSPGANEYAGDGPFTRDEITERSHLRGTVGVSTRGRDTGDGQIFVNLVDNVRLDFDYTIFAEVISGMDRVDAVVEGAAIESVTFTELAPDRR